MHNDKPMHGLISRYLDNNHDASTADLLWMFQQRCLADPSKVIHVIDLRRALSDYESKKKVKRELIIENREKK